MPPTPLAHLESLPVSRRRLLQVAALLPAAQLFGCGKPLEPLLRIGTNIWPGYELLYVARDTGLLDGASIKLVELLSATDVLQALSANTLEAAALTLDEVLTARASGIDLQVVAVLDVSAGADALLARPGIGSLAELRGCSIALEQTAVGAVLLATALRRAGLQPTDVKMVYRTVNHHVEAYRSGAVDAVVSFEPARSQLLAAGAHSLFDSGDMPGLIVDVLAVRPEAMKQSPKAVRALVAGHFAALARFRREPQPLLAPIAARLGLAEADALAAFDDLQFPDVEGNRQLLEGHPAALVQTAAELAAVMLQVGLLPRPAPLAELIDARWLPAREQT